MTAAPSGPPADRTAYERTVRRFRETRTILPTFSELIDPPTIPAATRAGLAGVAPDAPDARNLYRVHWHNAADRRGTVAVPEHVVLPTSITGVAAPIVVALGDRFPMIAAHKVLAAYACLVPRLVTGEFDPTTQRAVWPSTGNYCRGGVAISRILGCRGVAVLPAGMSRERFEWLERWVADPADIIRTPGTESNVKEIYDACADLARDPANVILNQFSEYGNHLVHWAVTGRALERVVESLADAAPGLRPAAFVSATGSAGTIGAGDWLKDRHGTKIVAVEALECPDDAPQRLRRAQHPGDRRQAHPAHPQRDEHGPRRRRSPTRRRTGSSCSSTPTPAGPTWPPRGVPERHPGRPAFARHLVDLQHPGRDQDGEAARPGPRRGGRDGRHRRRGDVPDRGRQGHGPRLPRRVRGGRGRRDLRAARPGGRHRRPARADAGRARADLQPRLLHLGRAAGRRRSTTSWRAATRPSGATCGPACRPGTTRSGR